MDTDKTNNEFYKMLIVMMIILMIFFGQLHIYVCILKGVDGEGEKELLNEDLGRLTKK